MRIVILILLLLSLPACLPGTSDPTPISPTPVPTAAPTENATPAQIEGLVWHDLCALAGGEGGAPVTPSEGCVQIADGAFQANGLLEAGEPGISGVHVGLGAGDCPAAGLATTTTDPNGNFSFSDLPAGAYCVSVDPLAEPNTSLLIPGGWTTPPSDQATINVTLNPGEVKTGVNFGWDFQFLPAPPQVSPSATTDPAVFQAQLIEALNRRDLAQWRVLMGDAFYIGLWRSEGGANTPEFAVDQLSKNQFVENATLYFDPTKDLTALLGGMDPLAILGPGVEGIKGLFVAGLGQEGKDEAILYIARRPDGSVYWHGILLSRGSFQR